MERSTCCWPSKSKNYLKASHIIFHRQPPTAKARHLATENQLNTFIHPCEPAWLVLQITIECKYNAAMLLMQCWTRHSTTHTSYPPTTCSLSSDMFYHRKRRKQKPRKRGLIYPLLLAQYMSCLLTASKWIWTPFKSFPSIYSWTTSSV